MTKDAVSFTLRMPKELSEKVNQLSKKMGVSKNAYILMILNDNFCDTKKTA
ncbi:hypothetical protein JIMMER1_65 [Brevibacillus phage Jimmer1]|uniref:Arc-like DNA binding domain-containing protein n=2 Tax=Jimmervirus jimmer TaxID=1984789 RepID=S5MBJ2_9CAUD|nr:Arc-like repressor [Brevibacillus phage Jimmer1]YP_009606492.1 Arc-like repressor [Brevibacillus phage Jimmer2]AGR47199.1 hypothetical protein JIMMER2_65 [Brevibacillus phage Jimmer2]AGR47300.1 hypothetical protein JIMMER1_65 [Brevibacillus phage Jimmer1]